MLKKIAFATLSSALILSACSTSNDAPPPSVVSDQSQYYTHTVSGQGETLASISKWYTGNAKNWQAILSYNPGLDVKKIRVGTQIRIPKTMLTKSKPMPKPSVGIAATQKPSVSEVGTIVPSTETTTDSSAPVAEVVTETTSETIDTSTPSGSQENVDVNVVEETVTESIDTSGSTYAPEVNNEDKSFLTKIQEGALKAKNAAIKVNNPNAGTEAVTPVAEAGTDVEAAKDAAKAAGASAGNQDSDVKSRDQLLKELSQDY